MNSLSHGCRRASSLGEGAFGMAGTLTVCRKLLGCARGPISEGAVCEADWGSVLTAAILKK